jgi:subtilisin-like proprotein convertase family protein
MMKKIQTIPPSSGLILNLVILLAGLATARAQSSARFAVIGDYGGATSAERDVANLVKSWSPDFIITVGDNNYPDGAASTIDANIGQFYHNFIYPYHGSYGAGATVNRFFPSLGNHDWYTSGATPYLNYFALPNNERYYDFVWGPVHCFAIDSDGNEPSGTSSTSTQGNWLKNKLAASTAKWKIVYFHHSPYSSGAEHGSSTWMQWPFQQWGATAVLSGHDHGYERLLINGLPYFVNGLGGESIYSFASPVSGSVKRYNGDYGAMLVQANGTTSLQFQFYSRGGTLIDTYTIQSTQNPPSIALATSLVSESGPVNGVIDPGERVTVNFTLTNSGGPTANLVATLQANSGVTSPSSAQTYGTIASGASVTKPFTFTASGANGATITTTLQLQNGTSSLGTVSKSFVLGPNSSLANTSPISIPGSGIGSPYPSQISVAGQPSNPSKVTVTLTGLSHTYADDVDVLLVGPGGQKTLLMSDAGGANGINNLTLTFDDAAAANLADSSAIVSGTYKPTDYVTGDTFPSPAPAGPYGTALSVFNGLNPNGTWSLYVVDDEANDSGSIAGGWSLNFTYPTTSAPTIALTSPANGATFTAPATVSLAASVTANGHTITKVQFYNGTTLLGEDTTAPYGFTWSSVPGGSYALTARAVYDAGSTVNSTAVNITVANTSAPNVALTSPANGATFTAPATVSLAASVTANGHTITKVQFYNGSTLLGEDTTSPYAFNWSGVPAGSYALTARAVYDAGSTVNSAVVNITVANTAVPTIALTAPANGATFTVPATVNLAASVTANGHTISKVQFYNGTTLLGEDTAASYAFTWTSVPAGSYSLTARAVYDAGSTVNSAAVNITVANTTPNTSPSNTTFVGIPDSGNASIYPSQISVADLPTNPSKITVTLKGISHTWPDDLDVVLVGPGGQKVLLMSDTGGGNDINNVTLTFDDAAASNLPDSAAIVSGTYKPTDFVTGDTFPSPAPAGPYGTALSVFNGLNPNGTWSLYVRDDAANDSGSIAGGWSLKFTYPSAPAGTALSMSAPEALPAPWQGTDIGTGSPTANAEYANGAFTLTGPGNISGPADNFRFAYQILSGDGEIKARIRALPDSGGTARVGVMIRESLTGGSKYAFMGAEGAGTFRWQQRSSTAYNSSSSIGDTGVTPYLWVRVVRADNTLTGYKSTDGVNWTQVNSQSITMGSNIYIGLAVASGSAGGLNTSVFDNVTVLP